MPKRFKNPRGRGRTFLKAYREQAGLTQEEIGDKFGLSGSQVSRIEASKSPYTQDFLEYAAHLYRTDVISLLVRDPNDPRGVAKMIAVLAAGIQPSQR